MRALSNALLDQACRESMRLPRVQGGRSDEPSRKPYYPSLPWNEFPDGAQYFDHPGVITTPALGTNDALVLAFLVPIGWDCVITGISNNYTGPGFVPGSGDLTWRIRVKGQFVKNYEAIQVELGSVERPRDTKILAHSGELVEYLVSVAAGAIIPIPATQIICFFAGYEWPRLST